MDAERIIGIVVFIIVVAAFIYDRIFGWRALGIAEVAYGIWVIRTRRVSYGWEGQPPSGYLTGGFAVIVGLLAVALGAVFVFVPEVIDGVLSNAQRGS
jgi:hypothetical protein